MCSISYFVPNFSIAETALKESVFVDRKYLLNEKLVLTGDSSMRLTDYLHHIERTVCALAPWWSLIEERWGICLHPGRS